jgi:hypothetical protein
MRIIRIIKNVDYLFIYTVLKKYAYKQKYTAVVLNLCESRQQLLLRYIYCYGHN